MQLFTTDLAETIDIPTCGRVSSWILCIYKCPRSTSSQTRNQGLPKQTTFDKLRGVEWSCQRKPPVVMRSTQDGRVAVIQQTAASEAQQVEEAAQGAREVQYHPYRQLL